MDYFSLLDLNKEPFSNSPDPDMFFNSVQHRNCLQKLELAIRLKRGLSVVTGDIGTGKSTLCRQLLRQLDKEGSPIIIHLILDPEFTSPNEFLHTILKTFGIPEAIAQSDWQMKEAIKNYLFHQGVDQGNTPALIIDEGQKLPEFCVEILREFLNYETNQHKLLQIVIFAQEEFQDILKAKPNFADRITTYQKLIPLSFSETKEMINFRIKKCQEGGETPRFFSSLALLAIYVLSGGYPRKIVMLCSKVIIAMIVKGQKMAGAVMVLSCARETSMSLFKKPSKKTLLATLLMAVFASGYLFHAAPKPDGIAASTNETKINQSPPLTQQTSINIQSDISEPIGGLPEKLQNEVPTLSNPPLKKKYKHQEISPTGNHPPHTTLGYLPIEGGTTLSEMVSRIYGRYTPKRLEAVLSKNHHITNLNQIPEQTIVHFPYLANKSEVNISGFVLILFRADSLEKAYNFIKEYPRKKSPLIHVVPQRIDTKTVLLQVAFQQTFPSKEDAAKAVALLPEKYRREAQIESSP